MLHAGDVAARTGGLGRPLSALSTPSPGRHRCVSADAQALPHSRRPAGAAGRRSVRPLGGGAAWTARPGGQAGCGVRAEGARPAAVGALCPTDRLCQTGSLALCTWGAWGRPGGRSWLRGEAELGLEGRPPRGPRGREPAGPSQQRAMAFVLRATVSPPPMSAPRNVGGA